MAGLKTDLVWRLSFSVYVTYKMKHIHKFSGRKLFSQRNGIITSVISEFVSVLQLYVLLNGTYSLNAWRPNIAERFYCSRYVFIFSSFGLRILWVPNRKILGWCSKFRIICVVLQVLLTKLSLSSTSCVGPSISFTILSLSFFFCPTCSNGY